MRASEEVGVTSKSIFSRIADHWQIGVRSPLLAILLLALCLRLVFVAIPSYHHPDEVFQYLEQAHRLLTGVGVLPWEYRDGIRHWLLPLLLVPPMWLADSLGFGEVEAARIFAVLVSLLIVVSFYQIGRAFSALHALVLGFIGATWFELVYFGSHTLSESFSLALFFPAAALLMNVAQASAKRIFLAGLLLGFAFLIRFQFGPAFAVLALLTCRFDVRRAWLPLIAGGVTALLVGAGIDLATGITPFSWLLKNFTANIVQDRAADVFGTSSAIFYFLNLASLWQTSVLLFIPLSLYGARRYPALYVAAIVHLLLHSLIGHKEYRFVILSTSVFVLFAGVGFVDLLEHVTRSWTAFQRKLAVAATLLFWLGTSVMLGATGSFRPQWTNFYTSLSAVKAARSVPGLCGVGIYDLSFYLTGGYAYLDRNVPIYQFEHGDSDGSFTRAQKAFNVVVAPKTSAASLGPSYRQLTCVAPIGRGGSDLGGGLSAGNGTVCVYQKPMTSCDGRGAVSVNDALRAQGM